jgi:hypothetical protein
LDNPDNRVLLAFFFSEMWVAEFLALRFDVPGSGKGIGGDRAFVALGSTQTIGFRIRHGVQRLFHRAADHFA